MLKFALLGTGRIGKMHAQNIDANQKCKLEIVYDINNQSANEIGKKYSCKVAQTAEEAISNSEIDVVYISTATPTHIDYILQAAKADKAIFCEKPIDLDIQKVNLCKKELEKYNVPIQIGFNRRFDPSHKSAKDAKDKGEIGKLEKIIITSRDPAPPGIDYLRDAGGMYRDMTIHDFDLMCYILGDDPIEKVFATGSILFNDDVKEINDMDTAMIVMKSKSGVLCHINNSRRAVYGYDQRIEIFGSKGMVISDNQTPSSLQKFNEKITKANGPIHYFFIERYKEAYKIQLDNFIDCVTNNKSTSVNYDDGRNALIVANGAVESFKSGKFITINFD